MRRMLHWLLILIFIGTVMVPQPTRAQSGTTVYLPLIQRNFNPLAGQRIVNAPFLDVADITGQKFNEMAIFWFGRVSQTENYTDVRVGYNSTELVIYTATIDRRLWYDQSPAVADLTAWDSVTVLLDLDGVVDGRPTSNSYRFVAQASWFEPRTNYQVAYQGTGSSWITTPINFTTIAGYRGSWIDNTDDKGWTMTFHIPFSSLGVSAPAQGAAIWGLSVFTHDRDDSGGTPIADKTWPETADSLTPSSWGRLAWGLQPAYTPPPSTPPTSGSPVIIKHKGASGNDLSMVVKDAGVGGSTTCGQNPNNGVYFDFWTQWGNVNDKDYNNGSPNPVVNVQNQSDISDYPCFSKIYLSFPLTAIPANKVIKNVTLTLYQTGGSGPASNGQGPYSELIQVLSFGEDFTDTTISWNSAPLALRNFTRTSVPPLVGCGGSIPWPCTPRTWDVTRLVAEAYQQGLPARIVLYSADSNYSTGKYFTSSNTADWNYQGRPKLTVEWGNP